MQVSAALRGRRLLARRQPGERRQLLVRRRMRSPRRKQTALGKSQCSDDCRRPPEHKKFQERGNSGTPSDVLYMYVTQISTYFWYVGMYFPKLRAV